MKHADRTTERLLAHYHEHPKMNVQDLCKYLHQSTFGCEHLVTDEQAAMDRIREEAGRLDESACAMVEPLDGPFSRVHLGYLQTGLSANTLGNLLRLSSKQCAHDVVELERKIEIARTLVAERLLPFDECDFSNALDKWGERGYTALHHSDAYRAAYKPAYRVIHNRYVPILPLLARIDKVLSEGNVRLAIEGGSASGKSTLGEILHSIYNCTVFHMDDFFLRPEQRTPERLAQVGGNIDIERFVEEVLLPLKNGAVVNYRRFDCSTATILPTVTLHATPLTVIEGAYSMHPIARNFYNMSIFLDVSSDTQRRRIQKRNGPGMAERFFNEWIPMEQRYFEKTNIRSCCDIIIPVSDEVDE